MLSQKTGNSTYAALAEGTIRRLHEGWPEQVLGWAQSCSARAPCNSPRGLPAPRPPPTYPPHPPTRPQGLVPLFFSPESGRWTSRRVSLGALGDSYYEYLLKVGACVSSSTVCNTHRPGVALGHLHHAPVQTAAALVLLVPACSTCAPHDCVLTCTARAHVSQMWLIKGRQDEMYRSMWERVRAQAAAWVARPPTGQAARGPPHPRPPTTSQAMDEMLDLLLVRCREGWAYIAEYDRWPGAARAHCRAAVQGCLCQRSRRGDAVHPLTGLPPCHPLPSVHATPRFALKHKFDHLCCFIPGMLALGATTGAAGPRDSPRAQRYLSAAAELAHTCWQMYHTQPSGGPPPLRRWPCPPVTSHPVCCACGPAAPHLER